MDRVAVHDVSLDTEAQSSEDKQEQAAGTQLESTTSKPQRIIQQTNVESDENNISDRGVAETVEVSADSADNGTAESGSTARPKRNAKPSLKSIETRIQTDSTKLERLWDRVMAVISQNRDLPDSIDQIRRATKEIHAIFHQYQTTWLSYMDFLAHGNTTECKGERETMDSIMNNRKQFLQTVLMEFEERKKDILLEMGSRRSSSRASSVSSAALRAQARAEVAVAIKKVEMQKRRSSVESQSILLIHQQEMALARKKTEEQARMEN
jgi:hypothetical protein